MSGLTFGMSFIDLLAERDKTRNELDIAYQKYNCLTNMLYDLDCELMEICSSFCVGDVVENIKTGEKYKLSNVIPECFVGNKIEKDGSISNKIEYLYDLDDVGEFNLI